MVLKRFTGVRGLFSTTLTFAIVFQLSLGSTILMAADSGYDPPPVKPKEYSVFQPNDLNLDAEDYLKSNDQFNEDEKSFIKKYFDEPARVTLDLLILARALAEKAATIVDVADKIKSRRSDQEISVELPGIGKAEFNSLGYKDSGKIFTRFVHYGTGTSYIFLDTDIVPLDRLTAEDKASLGDYKAIDEERDRSQSRSESNRYIAIQQMHTKVHPEEYNPFPNLSEIKPGEAASYLQELVDFAKKNPPKKKYDTSKKIKTGRLVKVIAYSGKEQVVKQIKEYQRYEDLSPIQRVAIYWRSVKQGTRLNWDYFDHGKIYQKPLSLLTGDVLVSLFSTVMQTGIFAALKGTSDPFSLLLVGGWAFAFSITPTARNWVNVNSSKSAVLFKSFLNSVIFNYILLTAIHGADVVFSMSTVAFNLAFLSVTNALINNFGKVWWYKIPQMRERAGMNLKKANILGLKTKVDQSSFEQQAWYLGSNIIRTADLIAMGSLFSIMNIDFTLSRVVMLMSIPTMHFLIMKYSERKDFKEKHILREEWEKANYLHWKGKPIEFAGHKVPIMYLGSVKMFFQESWIVATNSAKLIYWPGKVVFDLLKASSDNVLKSTQTKTKNDSFSAPACSLLFL